MSSPVTIGIGALFVLIFLSCSGDKGVNNDENGRVGPDTWQKTFGGSGTEWGSAVVPATGGGYVIAGTTIMANSDATGMDAYLIKLDEFGDLVWEKTYGGGDEDRASALVASPDGGYVFVGLTRSFGQGSTDAYLVKTDADGEMVWESTFGGVTAEVATSIAATPDGGYVVVGNRVVTPEVHGVPQTEWDSFLIKVDGSGAVVWERSFADSGDNTVNAVLVTNSGDIVIAGETNHAPSGGWGAFLLSTDGSGQMRWRTYFGGTSNVSAIGVAQSSDGGYVLAGLSIPSGATGSAVYLAKSDADGNELWELSLPGTALGIVSAVLPAVDGGFVAVGRSSAGGIGGFAGYMVKISEEGMPLWWKFYGGLGDEFFSDIAPSADGGYVMVGSTTSSTAGEADVFILKVKADGTT